MSKVATYHLRKIAQAIIQNQNPNEYKTQKKKKSQKKLNNKISHDCKSMDMLKETRAINWH